MTDKRKSAAVGDQAEQTPTPREASRLVHNCFHQSTLRRIETLISEPEREGALAGIEIGMLAGFDIGVERIEVILELVSESEQVAEAGEGLAGGGGCIGEQRAENERAGDAVACGFTYVGVDQLSFVEPAEVAQSVA